jgi:hypothetical protein
VAFVIIPGHNAVLFLFPIRPRRDLSEAARQIFVYL